MTQAYETSSRKNGEIKTLKSLVNDRDLCNETKTKTSVYVLEEPRDQDHGLEDYNTAII